MGWIQQAVNSGFGLAQAIWGRGGGSAARADYERVKKGQDSLTSFADYLTSLGKTQETAGSANTSAGLETTATGLKTLSQPKDYWSSILSGSRPAMMAAAAPEINAANEAAAQRRATESSFGTSRGGGTNAAAQDSETQRMTDINKALFAARQPAAEGLTNIGRSEAEIGVSKAAIGLQQMANALKALGMSETAIEEIIQSAQRSRDQSAAINKNTWRNLGQAVGAGENAVSAKFPGLGH